MIFQLKDAAQLALKKMPSAEQEALSQVGNVSQSHLSTLVYLIVPVFHEFFGEVFLLIFNSRSLSYIIGFSQGFLESVELSLQDN